MQLTKSQLKALRECLAQKYMDCQFKPAAFKVLAGHKLVRRSQYEYGTLGTPGGCIRQCWVPTRRAGGVADRNGLIPGLWDDNNLGGLEDGDYVLLTQTMPNGSEHVCGLTQVHWEGPHLCAGNPITRDVKAKFDPGTGNCVVTGAGGTAGTHRLYWLSKDGVAKRQAKEAEYRERDEMINWITGVVTGDNSSFTLCRLTTDALGQVVRILETGEPVK